MHEEWFYKQIEEYSDIFAREWEIFTLERSCAFKCPFEVRSLAREYVPLWVETKSQDMVAPDVLHNAEQPYPRLL
jgi:hypothetical protein